MRRSNDPSPPDLNLAPIMNMVVILIPLLLLSVVFLSVGVINVSAPSGIVDTKPTDLEEPPLGLKVAISYDGFIISTRDGVLKPVSGCPESGATICLSDETDVRAVFERSARAFDRGDTAAGARALDEAAAAYDWEGLNERLAMIKRDNGDETSVQITAEPDIPYMMVVETMDLTRFELDRDAVADEERALFPDPVLAVAR